MIFKKKKWQRSLSYSKLFLSRVFMGLSTTKMIAFLFLLGSLVVLDHFLVIPKKVLTESLNKSSLMTTQENEVSSSDQASEQEKTSWWDERHLSLYGESLAESIIDKEFAAFLAKRAKRRARNLNSKGNCLRAVRFNLWNALSNLKGKKEFLDLNKVSVDPGRSPYRYNPGKSAEHFRQWASNNPISLYRDLHLADVSHIPGLAIKEGFILVYKKGQYGFHNRYGHIEVVTSTSPFKACSDHCSSRKNYKEPDLILAPVMNYAPLYTFEDHSNSLTAQSI